MDKSAKNMNKNTKSLIQNAKNHKLDINQEKMRKSVGTSDILKQIL